MKAIKKLSILKAEAKYIKTSSN